MCIDAVQRGLSDRRGADRRRTHGQDVVPRAFRSGNIAGHRDVQQENADRRILFEKRIFVMEFYTRFTVA